MIELPDARTLGYIVLAYLILVFGGSAIGTAIDATGRTVVRILP